MTIDLKLHMINNHYTKRVSQLFRQYNHQSEIKNRQEKLLGTTFPILQINGQDEFSKYDGKQSGYFPYFGKFNLYDNEIENITDKNVEFMTENTKIKKSNLTKLSDYSLIKTKKNSRFNMFAIIPNS